MELPGRMKDSVLSETGGFLKTGIFSLILHMGLLVSLSFTISPAISRGVPNVFRVNIRPFSSPGGGIPEGSTKPGLPGPSLAGASEGISALPAAEKQKPVPIAKLPAAEKEKPVAVAKRNETVEGLKPRSKVTEKNIEKPKKEEKTEKELASGKSLQEALDAIRKKAALDDIQKRVTRREKVERPPVEGKTVGKQVGEGQPSSDFLKNQLGSSSKTGTGPGGETGKGPGSGSGTGSGAGSGAGSGTGSGAGSGTGGSSTGGVPWGSPYGSSFGTSKWDDYYGMIWARIKNEWTLPENLPQGKIDLETTIVFVIDRGGKVQKSWFEKKSGNSLYDQMAMRAIKKAEPFPPIPKDLSDNTLEIGIRFYPDDR